MKHFALIVAAGSSTRLPGDRPKPYRLLGGKAVLRHSVACFLDHPQMAGVAVVIHPAHRQWAEEALHALAPSAKGEGDLLPLIEGGSNRQASVQLGLEALVAHGPQAVLIHDAARPRLNPALIDRVLDGLQEAEAVIPALPVTDTIKQVTGGRVSATLNREQLAAAQTPQGFAFDIIMDLHRRYLGQSFTDDAALAEAAGVTVKTVAGESANIKLTTQDDWEKMSFLFENQHPEPDPQAEAAPTREARTGMGFDVHQLIQDRGRPLRICGVEIPGEWALEGHSDADVGLHALTDALLGALAAGDIGEHFPPTQARWKNADSADFVRETMCLLTERQGRVVHADITLIAERPKMAPHRAAMRETVGHLLNIERDRVSIKATTTEGLGFIGRGEGIAAQAVVTVMVRN